jgi:hypothetical protein
MLSLMSYNQAVWLSNSLHRENRKNHYAVVELGELFYVKLLKQAAAQDFQSIVYTTS